MFEWIASPEAWVALFTLAALEIVLGIDNIIFISILVGRLPEQQRQSGRLIGLGLAMGMRILLLLSLSWVMSLTTPLFTVFGEEISGRDLILLLGGLFLVAKSTHEIHHAMSPEEEHEDDKPKTVSFLGILTQIAILDIVFSLDSVITAVGMVDQVGVMIVAIIMAVGVMMFAAKPIGDFVETHPTLKVLALSFLILIGVALIGESLDFHIPKGYIYFAMGFSVVVEMINIKMRKKLLKKPSA
ncbi:TerC family protein [Bisgaard Taxon 45]|uniref:TerC family protein n=1 Tax=Bisgaard Taxon 45 TaxID=304289 RepID=A0ABT9KC76_9PAST|nr:TerC family protein [Bisgaard Taxon 45]